MSAKKQKALEELEKLNEDVLVRLSELSKNKKALSFFQSSISFAVLKGYLKTL